MATAQDVIRVAASQVGYTEGRYNWTKFSAEMYGGRYQNQPWCGVYVDWCFSQTGMLAGEPSSVYTPAGAAGYQAAGRWTGRTGSPASGDVVYFDWGGSQSVSLVDHVGLVEAVTPDYILTLEGNTSSGMQGSQDNGDGVYRRKRPRSVIVGFGRPQYQPGPSPVPPPDIDWKAIRRMAAAKILNDGFGATATVQQGSGGRDVLLWQRALNLVGGARLVEDGAFGPGTKQAAMNFQRWMGLTPDGVCGPVTKWWMTTALQNIRDGKS